MCDTLSNIFDCINSTKFNGANGCAWCEDSRAPNSGCCINNNYGNYCSCSGSGWGAGTVSGLVIGIIACLLCCFAIRLCRRRRASYDAWSSGYVAVGGTTSSPRAPGARSAGGDIVYDHTAYPTAQSYPAAVPYASIVVQEHQQQQQQQQQQQAPAQQYDYAATQHIPVGYVVNASV